MTEQTEKNPTDRKVVVITGGTAGVGRATALEFAERGYAVAVLARGEERLKSTRQELEAMGAPALSLKVDVADADAVEQAAGQVEETLGPIDVWINCAMTSVFAPVDATESEEYQRVMAVCFLGYVHGTKAALKRMRPRNRGVIVLTGSALAYRGIPLQSAYCAAKHAIQGFHDSLRTELLHDGSAVQVTMVQLPALNTPQFEWVRSRLPERAQPVPPIYEPEFAARALYKAALHPRREYLVGKSSCKAVWGNRLLPGVGDRVLAKMGFESQQTGEPDDHLRPDNLYEPYPGDEFGTHGRFSERAKNGDSLADRHPIATRLGAAGLAAGAIVGACALKGLLKSRGNGTGRTVRKVSKALQR